MAISIHEPLDQLSPLVVDQHRCISSITEELEAITWYNQRAAVTKDAALKAQLEHNRDEEIEHAIMLLEWLRRNFPGFDAQMKKYLFTTGDVTKIEADGGNGEAEVTGGLNIGSMKK